MIDIRTLIRDQHARRRDLQALERYVLEDQWAGGDGWTGPKPIDLDTRLESSVLTLIEAKFVARNVLAEVITRHRDGVLSREPSWTLGTDRGNRKTLTKEAEAALTTWWDTAGAHHALQAAVTTLAFARETSTAGESPRPARSPMRLYLRAQSIIDGRIPKRSSLEEALGDIGVHAAAPYAAGVLRNADGDPIGTHYTFEDDDGSARVELTGVARILREHGAPVPEGAPPDATVVLITDENGTPIAGEAGAWFDLGGALLMHELTREPLITPAAITLQKLINKAFSMMSHNLDVAGFTERTLLNAQMPGRWLDKDGAPTTPENGVRFQPDPVFVGAGATNWFSGLPQTDQDGTTRFTTPNIVYRDPVPPEAFTATIADARAAVYEETKQLHVLISGDATTSGRSRIQAANDFVASLELTAAQVEHATRWMLSTALALASVLMGAPRRYAELRPTVTARLAAVQPTPEDVRTTIEKRTAGLVSTETAMSEIGIEDVDAERAKIRAEATDDGTSGEDDAPPSTGEDDSEEAE